MAQTVRIFSHRKNPQAALREERKELLEGLERTKVLIGQAYSCFNGASDPDLIESYVFEINALQRRYSYLLRRVRQIDEVMQTEAAEV